MILAWASPFKSIMTMSLFYSNSNKFIKYDSDKRLP